MKETWANDRLDTLLAELARRDAALMPAHTLEARTRAAWDEWRRRSDPPGRGFRIGGLSSEGRASHTGRGSRIGGAVACVGAAVGMVLALIVFGPAAGPNTPTDGPAPAVAVGDPPAIERPSHAADKPAHELAEPVRRRRPEDAARRRSGPPESAEWPASASFVPIGPGVDRDLGAFQVARVPVSRGVLAGLGLLPDDQRGGEAVMADVVFGEDGMAKAIRISSTSRRAP